MKNNDGILEDVVIIRLLLIVSLVLYHVMAPYCAAWPKIDGQPSIRSYWWLGKFIYSFLIPTFVFISGEVYGFQVRKKKKSITFRDTIENKFKRLILPSAFFSTIYFFLIEYKEQSVLRTIYDIFSGVGHLWFLPMLFWCFVLLYVIEKCQLKDKHVIPFLLLMAIISYFPLPFQFRYTLFYMIYFFCGYKFTEEIKNRICNTRFLSFLLPVYLLSFWGGTILVNDYTVYHSFIIKALVQCGKNLVTIIFSFLGMATIVTIVNLAFSRNNLRLSPYLLNLSGCCMGVYIFQQFIIKILYKSSVLVNAVGFYWLPWIAFLIALAISLGLTRLFLKTTFGRKLIG